MGPRGRDGKPDDKGRTEPLDFQAAPRAAQALRLRRLGYTYERIGEACGYANESGARKAVKQASRRIIRDEARELVALQLDHIDQALRVVLARIAKDDAGSLWAVDRIVPLLKRQAELMGLDAERSAAGTQNINRTYEVVSNAPSNDAA